MPNYLKRSLTIVFLCLFLVACSKSGSTRYYLLEAQTNLPAGEDRNQDTGMLIGLGPVNFPDYLKRSQIIMRDNRTEVFILDGHRWAEPLQENFIRVLAQDLLALHPSARVIVYPSRQWSEVDQQVIIDVNRFDSDSRGETVLETQLTLIRKGEPAETVTRYSRLVLENKTIENHAGMVDVLSRLVQQLAEQITIFIGEAEGK